MKAGRLHALREKTRKEEEAKQSQQHPRTRQDMVLSWEARRGSSTALVGLGRAGEALAEAEEAVDLADQVGKRVSCLTGASRCQFSKYNGEFPT